MNWKQFFYWRLAAVLRVKLKLKIELKDKWIDHASSATKTSESSNFSLKFHKKLRKRSVMHSTLSLNFIKSVERWQLIAKLIPNFSTK